MSKNGAELIEALDTLEREKQISKDVLFEAIENSILAACKSQYGKSENIRVNIDRKNGDVKVYADLTVVEEPEDPQTELTVESATARFPGKAYDIGDVISVEVTPKDFGRIAAGAAKQAVVQKIREEERNVLFNHYKAMEKLVVTGTVQRFLGRNISVNLGKCDGMLIESEQIKADPEKKIQGDNFRLGQRVKAYVLEVVPGNKGPKITLSRTHPDLVKRLFEMEVTEIESGVVEIMSISRDPGQRTKIAVRSNEETVDPIGACVGPNGNRVNAVVDELNGEKVDIVQWSENPEIFIKNALSPAKVVYVSIDNEERSARVVVQDHQLSLAIGREGQNARLAARLTGYKIDIKSESQVEETEE